MTVKAGKDGNYIAFKNEIQNIMTEQDDFLSELYVWMQQCESLDKAEVTSFFCKKIYICIYSFETANHPQKNTRPVMVSLMRT